MKSPAIVAILLVALVVLGLSKLTATPPTPVQTPVVKPYTINFADGIYNSQRESTRKLVDQAYVYINARYANQVSDKPFVQPDFEIWFIAQQDCDNNPMLTSIADVEKHQIMVATCSSIPTTRAINLLAHELVNQMMFDREGSKYLSADIMVAKGLSTYIAGSYWLNTSNDFKSFMRDQYGATDLLPLATPLSGTSPSTRNKLFYESASFVEYLLYTYGKDKFNQLFLTGDHQVGTAEYQSVFGKSLDQLEQDWKLWLSQ